MTANASFASLGLPSEIAAHAIEEFRRGLRSFPLRRGLSKVEAAVYLSLSPRKFRNMVRDGRLPQPREADNRLIWDVEEFELAFKALPQRGGDLETFGASSGDSWDDYT